MFTHTRSTIRLAQLSLKEHRNILPLFNAGRDASPAYLNVEATECLIFVKRSRQANGPIVQAIQLDDWLWPFDLAAALDHQQDVARRRLGRPCRSCRHDRSGAAGARAAREVPRHRSGCRGPGLALSSRLWATARASRVRWAIISRSRWASTARRSIWLNLWRRPRGAVHAGILQHSRRHHFEQMDAKWWVVNEGRRVLPPLSET